MDIEHFAPLCINSAEMEIEGPGTWSVQLFVNFSVYMDVKIPGHSVQGNLNTIHSINQFSSVAGGDIFTHFSSTIEKGTKLFFDKN